MTENIRFKDIYPVALFVIILMMWGLSGATSINTVYAPPAWSKLIQSKNTKNNCKDDGFFPMGNPSCTEEQDPRTISPLLASKSDSDRLYLSTEQNSHLNNQ